MQWEDAGIPYRFPDRAAVVCEETTPVSFDVTDIPPPSPPSVYAEGFRHDAESVAPHGCATVVL